MFNTQEIVIYYKENFESILTKWKIKDNTKVSEQTIICECKSSSNIKIRSGLNGQITELVAKEGQSLKIGDILAKILLCQHVTLWRNMCAECGADLKDVKDRTATIAMEHSIPDLLVSEKCAKELGKLEVDYLLKSRKLVLLLDLDQTLIHTTNNNISNLLQDVYHFQLRNGKRQVWYHTKFRPHLRKFLSDISKLYELHICTFGIREYAHNIANLIDPERKIFQHRILSRDECFHPSLKTLNLKSLFPCGDSMVCIVDDREDVWKNAPNLVQVKPYIYFAETGDINSSHFNLNNAMKNIPKPEKLNKKKLISKNNVKFFNELESIQNNDQLKNEPLESLSQNKLLANELIDPESQNIFIEKETSLVRSEENMMQELEKHNDFLEINNADTNIKENIIHQNLDDLKSEINFSLVNSSNEYIKNQIEESNIFDFKNDEIKMEIKDSISNELHSMDYRQLNDTDFNKGFENNETSINFNEKKETSINFMNNMDTGFKTDSDKNNIIINVNSDQNNIIINVNSDKNNIIINVDTKNMIKENHFIKNEEKLIDVKNEETIEMSNSDLNTNISFQQTFEQKEQLNIYNGVLDINDSDNYLLFLTEILTRIHTVYYDMYDQSTTNENSLDEIDMKRIVPYVRKKVLKGCNLLFSGIYPTNQDFKTTWAYMTAKSLGANIHAKMCTKANYATTHLIAARRGTEKFKLAEQQAKIHIVNIEWLRLSSERWTRQNEKLFPVISDINS